MSDDIIEEDGALENAIRYGSILLPLADARPSTAVNFMTFNPVQGELEIHWKAAGSETTSAPCDLESWASYKMNPAASAGQFANQFVHRGPSKAPKSSFSRNPYPRKF